MTSSTPSSTSTFDPRVAAALATGGIIDISTTGRRSGRQHRVEIAFFNFSGHVYISGMPGRRDWYANLVADPRLTVHLKRGVTADVPAGVRLVTDPGERRELLAHITRHWRREAQIETFVADSPLIEVIPDDATLLAA